MEALMNLLMILYSPIPAQQNVGKFGYDRQDFDAFLTLNKCMV